MRQVGKNGAIRGVLIPTLVGIGAFAALTLLCAELIRRGIIPMDFAKWTALVSLALSALLAGACCRGGGKRAVAIGAVFCAVCLVGKGLASDGSFWCADTAIGGGICLLTLLIGSCIFHKTGKTYTKRNRRKRGAR